jgi:hypothetical protein
LLASAVLQTADGEETEGDQHGQDEELLHELGA